ncbi:hypothetical protein [Psychromonas sp. MME2]|uniref:hypothetical protein n=1 Tax=Psychromonas sp. MME2 TaxID=3231033 RepID=UPI00339BB889
MQILHEFQNLRAAQAFSDYLHSLGIANHIEDNEFIYPLLIEEQTQYDAAKMELQTFLHNPNKEKYLAASWQTGSTNQISPSLSAENSHLLANFIAHGGLLTNLIIAICIAIYALTSLGLFDPIQSSLAFFYQ